LPDPSKRDDLNGYALLLDRKTIDRLAAVRGPGESYSYVIIRLAEGDGGEDGRLEPRLATS
jgi:hypothetical protein